MCGNKEDAEDIVQNTFFQALTHINGFKSKSSIYTWLFSIARNLCLKHLGESKKTSFTDIKTLITVAKSACPDNLTVFEIQDYTAQVKEGCLLGLLRCLSFNQRMSFILNVLLGMKTRDTAVIIGKSETAVRLLVMRAKRNLKNFMCRNCSLYDSANPCRCENLIDFSIKQAWIKANDSSVAPLPAKTARQVEQGLDGMKKMIRLYESIQDRGAAENLLYSLKEEINNSTQNIFSDKKVK